MREIQPPRWLNANESDLHLIPTDLCISSPFNHRHPLPSAFLKARVDELFRAYIQRLTSHVYVNRSTQYIYLLGIYWIARFHHCCQVYRSLTPIQLEFRKPQFSNAIRIFGHVVGILTEKKLSCQKYFLCEISKMKIKSK